MAHRILIVEDNEKNRLLIRELLLYHGYEVLEAEDGAQGVKIAKEQIPDLILMDIQMPVMNGYRALAALKADLTTRGIKVIALTSYAMKGDREKALSAGFDGYIPKPIDTRMLPKTIKSFLK